MRTVALLIVSIVGFGLPSFAQSPSARAFFSACDAVLVQNLNFSTVDERVKAAYFMLVDRTKYEEAKHNAGASYAGLFGANYEDFAKNRETYRTIVDQHMTHDLAVSVAKASLSAEQVQAWEKCVTQDAVGVRVLLSNENAQGASGRLYYTGTPGQQVRIAMAVEGGLVDQNYAVKYFRITSPGSQAFTLTRGSHDGAIRVTVNTDNSLSDVAFSPAPVPAPPATPAPPTETLLSLRKPTTASSGSGSTVVDGNDSTAWNSGAPAPQWVQIDLGQPRTVTFVEMITEQLPPGLTRHTVYGLREDGSRVVLADFNFPTASGTELKNRVALTVGRGIKAVRVETTQSPSWIAWREIKVWGY